MVNRQEELEAAKQALAAAYDSIRKAKHHLKIVNRDLSFSGERPGPDEVLDLASVVRKCGRISSELSWCLLVSGDTLRVYREETSNDDGDGHDVGGGFAEHREPSDGGREGEVGLVVGSGEDAPVHQEWGQARRLRQGEEGGYSGNAEGDAGHAGTGLPGVRRGTEGTVPPGQGETREGATDEPNFY